uniref:Leucine rich adaptor protein 1 n=1 Tax=Geotrypetes seraphini TaxID=260995 RepID=A0A6P8NQW2_GEOSA|nr:leucine rich adaptor protein 1 [Geotrypetes seraphini]XP_033773145.1 leucine rich adaptor protein 1 [Geotrypetes seraphini]XP_033773146.1 leucine rich adaptor protein 1 [Geotrypetes seraphini]
MEGFWADPLKDLESKVGRKPPEGLLRWLREDPAQLQGESPALLGESGSQQGLGAKIKALKLELAYLRAIDVKILHQLVTINEGIEAVKWLLEEKGTLTSRCSSLTSSQYSLIESQETSRRGSWNSFQDPNDKLDSISIGSYLDTLADEMDEYCQSTSESIMAASTHQGLSAAKAEQDRAAFSRSITPFSKMEQGKGKVPEDYLRAESSLTMPIVDQEAAESTRVIEQQRPEPSPVANGFLGKQTPEDKLSTVEKQNEDSHKVASHKSSKVESDQYKLNNQIHLEYDTHWRWVQSQDDVTFL